MEVQKTLKNNHFNDKWDIVRVDDHFYPSINPDDMKYHKLQVKKILETCYNKAEAIETCLEYNQANEDPNSWYEIQLHNELA